MWGRSPVTTVDTYARPSVSAGEDSPRSTPGLGLAAVPHSLSLRLEVAFLVLVDALVATLAVLCGLDVRFDGSLPAIAGLPYSAVALGFPVLWVSAMALGHAYDRTILAAGAEEYRRVLNTAVWFTAGIAAAAFALHLELSRGFVGTSVPLAILGTLICRHVTRKGLHRYLATGAAIHRVVVVGSQESTERLARHMRRTAFTGYTVVGSADLPWLGRADDLDAVARQTRTSAEVLLETVRRLGADTIAMSSGDTLGHNGLQRLSWRLEGTGIKLLVAPDAADLAGPRILVRPVAGLPLLHIEEPEFRGRQRVLKECIDRLGAGLLLLIAAPALAVIAAAALISHGRPILYRQERVGRHGDHFTIHKFRTMHNGADRRLTDLAHLNLHDGELFKIREDPRVTPLGRQLRRYSLDELPQLWDVLRGSMSLVGPRPPLAREVEKYGDDARRRLLVKPGITGLWQVSGRSDLAWEETVRLDLHYVENWSVALDLTLLWKTLSAVIRPQGAY
ncbi:MAG: exopolysaccharide biosynthesis polyprenyl glycosylphosphotransferase [Chloroflexi bacterium]|nr:exopolysaccharide biosynthesis polyprenyl glycosylphosphotransferase [Chloroflexota bacterium]